MTFNRLLRAIVAALALVLAPVAVRADVKDYEFRFLEDSFQSGETVVSVRLIDKRSGRSVPGAEIVARRMDMEPDGMAEMTTSLDILPVSEPGLYRFKTDLTMEGRWRLSLTVKVPGEDEVLQSSLVVKAVSEPVSAPVPATGKGRLLYYRNPMGLPDTSSVPKKDSMGMDYLPVYEGEEGDGTTIKLSPGRVQRSGVRSELVRRQAMTRTLRVPGVVMLDERLVSVVALRADAFIHEVAPVTTGDRVSKGARLARIYSPDISAASAQFITELGAVGRGAPEGGARQRLENLGVPPAIVAEIERNRKVPSTINWTAPRDGVVLERNAVEGMKAPAGSTLFRLADLSTVWVVADVPEGDVAAARIGTPATVRLRGRPESSFAGRISLIYPQVAEATRTVKVRIELANPEGLLLPNMFAEVDIRAGDAAPMLVVHESAVIDSGMRRIVILDRGEGRFEPREVTIGPRGDGMVAIRDGVSDGDRVVVAANFLIDAESNLQAALRALSSAETQP